jgi:outer membrane lipoprotein SlyB
VIESVNKIATRGEGSGLGAAGGAVVGGLLGNQVGGGKGRDLATIAGAVGGALAGNHIEGNVRTRLSYNISVRLNDGSRQSFSQAEQPVWQVGDQVRVVDGSIRANG